MMKGDLVVPYRHCVVMEMKDVTLMGLCRHRTWDPDQPAVIVAGAVRNVRGIDVLKFQILLGGELWWTGAGAVRRLDGK